MPHVNKESLTVVFSTRADNPAFRGHLRQTCGIEDVEILQYVNNGEHALTETYNRGLRESKNTVVVFVHDDVIFDHGSGWGKTILRHSYESEFGILGKAGTTSITESGKWWDERHLMVGVVRHQGVDPETGKLDTWENAYSGNFGDRIVETVMVDGVFFAVHRERIRKGFDESIKGFHFYDVDFSFANHLDGVRVGVIFDIEIIHKSIGATNEQWENNRLVFIDKWRSHLPYRIEPEIMYEDPLIICREEPEAAVVILAQNGKDSLIRTIDSIFEKTRYPNYSIYIAAQGNDPEFVREVKDSVEGKGRLVMIPCPSDSPSRIKNLIIRNHVPPAAELLLFCHDDILLLNDAVSRCVQIYLDGENEIGTIGVRLHLGDNTIQHAGLQLGMLTKTQVRISHKGYGSFYQYTPGVQRDIFSNAGAFMMVSKDAFISLGCFSEKYLSLFEDIDFNVRALLHGKVNCFTGDAVGYHYELETRNVGTDIPTTQVEDLRNLMGYIHENLNDPRLAKHVRQ
ncbi:MAG: glycosyltransferase [Nitrospirota bacterium]